MYMRRATDKIRRSNDVILILIFIFSNARTVRGRWRKDSNADVHSMGRPAACLGSSSL